MMMGLQEKIIQDTISHLYSECERTVITITLIDTADLYHLLMQKPKYKQLENDEMFIKALNNINITDINLKLIQKIEETL